MRSNKFLIYMICLFVFLLSACNAEDLALDQHEGRGTEQEHQARGDQQNTNQDPMISSDYTTMSSDQYPHTKAILVQPSKYIYVEVEEGQQNQNGQQPRAGTPQQPIWPQQPKNETPQQGDWPQPQQPETETPQQGDWPQPQQPETETPQQGDWPQPPPEAGQPQQPPTQDGAGSAEGIGDIEAQVIELTNAERERNGLPALQADRSLSSVAREKSNDMHRNNYFSHTSPTYGSPFDMMRDMGVSYRAAAENIAQGQPTPEQVVQAWMNSAGHRQNILNGNFTHIGVGYQSNGHYWTQMFISK